LRKKIIIFLFLQLFVKNGKKLLDQVYGAASIDNHIFLKINSANQKKLQKFDSLIGCFKICKKFCEITRV
jgi:hypothetical protein